MSIGVTHLCSAHLDGREFIFLWEDDSEAPKPVNVDSDGLIVTFKSTEEALKQLSLQGKTIAQDPPQLYDFDWALRWCQSPDETVDCSRLLDIWNILTDVPGAKDLFDLADARADNIYENLVQGCNLPALRNSHEEYIPIWSHDEVAELKRLLNLGITDFRSRLSLG